MHIRKFRSRRGRRGSSGIPFDYGRKRARRGIFRCKSDRNERSGLFATLIVRRNDRFDAPLDIDRAFPPIRFIRTSIERIGSIETVDRLLTRRGFHPRCRANNSLRRVENAAVVRRRRRRRRTAASWPVHCSFCYVFI